MTCQLNLRLHLSPQASILVLRSLSPHPSPITAIDKYLGYVSTKPASSSHSPPPPSNPSNTLKTWLPPFVPHGWRSRDHPHRSRAFKPAARPIVIWNSRGNERHWEMPSPVGAVSRFTRVSVSTSLRRGLDDEPQLNKRRTRDLSSED